ncbi:MAG TPA: polyphenol oxidase family protein [Gemmatimonadales bacterium]|nr:polyphenol oxidase family protein [Gemmatimonadales bacterium]
MTAEAPLPGRECPRYDVPGWRERFGVSAGITGRGTGPEPFDLGLWSSGSVGATMRRWRQLREALPEFPAQVMAHQVHGSVVLWHDPRPSGWTLHEAADGHATTATGLLLLVTVADCVPIYLVAPAHGAIALLHSGWRGTAAGILQRGVALLAARTGAQPPDLVMHTGVAISGPRYEVGREVMEGVGEPATGPGPWHLDIRALLGRQARALGIGEVTTSPLCTAQPDGPFFSHRGSGGADGRMVAWLGRLPAE